METNLKALAAIVVVLAAAAAGETHAQSIDYGSLQQLFNEPVTTSATGSPQRATSAPVPMDIISAADIKRSGAVDIPTILSRLAGVNTLTWGSGSTDVGVRGYNQALSPRLLVLINGRQVYIDSYGYTDWGALPVSLGEIRQIEVVKGPNSALFGFNAVSGVINIVTYNPKYDSVGSAKATVGSQAYGGVDLAQTINLGDVVSSRVSVGASRANEFKNTNNPTILPGSLRNPNTYRLSSDSIAQLTSKLQARLEISWSHDDASDLVPNSLYSRFNTYTGSQRLTFIDDSPVGLLEGSVYQNEAYTKFVDFGSLSWNNRVLVAKVQDLIKLGSKDTVRVALEYRHNQMNSSPIDEGTVSYDVVSPSVMWNSELSASLSTTVAVRYDQLNLGFRGAFPSYVQLSTSQYDRSIGATSVNAGVVYQASANDTFRLSFARGVQSPTLAELGGFHAVLPTPYFNVDITGNPNIKPSLVTNYEGDWDRTFPAISAKANLRVYYQTTSDIKGLPSESGLDFYPTASKNALIWFENAGDSSMVGVEAAASGTLSGGWRWNANYTYTNVHNSAGPDASLIGHFVDFAASTPKHMANLGLGWTGGGWTVDGWAHYVSSSRDYPVTYDLPTLVKVPDYATADGRVAYSLTPKLTLALSGQQLNAPRIVETVGLPVERRVFLTLSADW